MITDFKVKTFDNGMERQLKSENIIMVYDNVLDIVDIGYIEYIRENKETLSSILDYHLLDTHDEKAIIPILFDRTERNILKWLGKVENANYDRLYKSIFDSYREDILKHSKHSKLMYNLPVLLNQKNIDKITIVFNDDICRQKRINDVIKILGEYAYRINIVFLKDGETLSDYIVNQHQHFTMLFTDSIYSTTDVIEKMLEHDIQVNDKCFAMSKLSYNFKLDEETGIITSKDDLVKYINELGSGFGYFDLLNLSDKEYYTLG